MPTWYSIRNRLEAGEVKARNSFERFLTSFITSYGCLDVWYRSVASDSSELECRIFYIQSDDSYVATETWERTGERPEFWLQMKGTAATIRATIISLLPYISQLHSKKRHGEWNFGPTEPFLGEGSITVDINGNTIITGRFGDIALYNNGVELNWEDIVWNFDGCATTATCPPTTSVCFSNLGYPIEDCTGTVGTCVRGSCGSWIATYPESLAECDGTWYVGEDLTSKTGDYWDTVFSCPDPTGTCVTGDCTLGFTASYPVTEAACTGDWFKGVDLSGEGPAYWDEYYDCEDPIGCCVVGTTCNWDSISVTTESECATLGGTWTEGVKGKECTIAQYEEDNNCNPAPPQSISYVVTYYVTDAWFSAPLFPGIANPAGPVFDTSAYENNWYTHPAVTPGSQVTWPLALQASSPDFCAGYTLNNYSYNKTQVSGSLTLIYNFSYLSGDKDEAIYGIDSIVGHPGFNLNDQLVTFNTDIWSDNACCFPFNCCTTNPTYCEGIHYYQHLGTMTTINATLNGTLTRTYNAITGNTNYYGIVTVRPQDSSLSNTTIEFGSNVSYFSTGITDSPSKWVSAGAARDDYPKKIHIGSVTIQNNTDVSWGDNLVPYTYEAGADGLFLAGVQAYRLTNTILETA